MAAGYPRLNAHDPAWLEVMQRGFGHRVINVPEGAEPGPDCLPLALVQSPLFGKYLVSLPYLNTGGVWASNDDVAGDLVDQAVRLADQLDVKHLELRHELPLQHDALNAQRKLGSRSRSY